MQAAPPVAAPMVVSTIQTPQRKEHYMSKAVLGLSVTQIIIGALCILLQIVLIGIHSIYHFLGQGIWTGVFFILSGSFGIVSSRKKTTCFIVAFLVLAIISAVITIGIFLFSSYENVTMNSYLSYCYYSSDGTEICVSKLTVISINTAMIILAVVQVVVASISSAFSCHGLCGGNQNQPLVMAQQMQYVQGPDGQQQMVIVPLSHHGADLPAGPSFNPVQADLPGYDQTPPQTYEGDTKLLIPE